MPPSKINEQLAWQLQCIRQCIEGILENPDRSVVDAGSADVQTVDSQYILVNIGDFAVQARPAYPGSILHDEVSVTITQNGIYSTKPKNEDSRPAQDIAYISADAHYARFHSTIPLITKDFYHYPRITFFTQNSPALNASLKAELQIFWNSQYPTGSCPALRVHWCPTAIASEYSGKTQYNQGPKGFVHSTIDAESIPHNIMGPVAIHDRAALINKSDIVITDDIGIAMDSITSSVPLGFSSTPNQLVDVQSSFNRYLVHQDRSIVTEEQKMVATRVNQTLQQRAIVITSRQALAELLVNQLCMEGLRTERLQNPHVVPGTELAGNAFSPILKPYACAGQKKVSIDTMDKRLNNSRRKWRKFRESPKRFLVDSQHWALKPVKGFAR